ncbi:MAG: helix-turn-helix transcriptional regulator [Candidatus Paceibacterota bacterium]|jgi:DNA-binding XRE family transcriptional regulator
MKEQITGEFVDITIRVPAPLAARMQRLMEEALELIEDEDEERLYDFEELFPNFHAGNALRGARTRESLTQAQLAERVGIKIHHISEMENGKRPIGKEMAKRLAKALNTSYKVFL